MDQFAKETIPISLEEEMRKSYLDYAMSVIVGRALPDARDGLKPVHRRVLFGMHELNNVWNRPYVKCARVVGEVMGKYHPHGDASIYDTLVRMAQDFSLRYMWWLRCVRVRVAVGTRFGVDTGPTLGSPPDGSRTPG